MILGQRIAGYAVFLAVAAVGARSQTPTLSPPPPVTGPQPPVYTPPSAAPAGKPQTVVIPQGSLRGVVSGGVGW